MSLVCERHRDETGQQQPGICPSCLRERLAQLTTDRSIATTTRFGGLWSDASSRESCHFRHGSATDRSSSASMGVEDQGLWKSYSVSGGGGDRRKRKKKGFWSKLTKMTWQKMT